jgi:membrane-associated phospholipid phosphatase
MKKNISSGLNCPNNRFLVLILSLIFILALLLCLNIQSLSAQTDTSQVINKKYFNSKREILPLSLIGVGTALNFSNIKYFIHEKIGNTTNIRLDNYMQYAPIADLYVADLAGIRHKNSVWDQTKYLAISEIISTGLVESVKYIAKVKAPNGESSSFPSGHTVIAFTSATVLFEEFKDDNLPVAVSGYVFSTATGILRMTNNYHWISDVLTSAGIGILVANVVYYYQPLKNWKPLKLSDNLEITPNLGFSNKYPLLGFNMKIK